MTNPKLMRIGIVVILALLIIQFIAGMYLNFYAQLPDSHPGTQGSYAPSIPWAIAGHAGLALAIHVTNWILLSVGAIALVVRGVLSRRKAFIIGNSLGLLCILFAGSAGLGFLNRGGQDKDSFMMALGFILAFINYGITFYVTKEH
jgi:nitric oxide reductase large subunit